MRSEIEALGYIGLEVSDIGAWYRFAQDILGLSITPGGDGLHLRMDEYAWRIGLSEGKADDLSFLGWEVSDQRALDALVERLQAAGVSVELGDAALAEARRVHALVRFNDPEGNRHEAFFGALQKSEDPFVSPLGVKFNTGEQGLGHVVLSCRDTSSMTRFFVETLGFRVSDYINTEIVPGKPIQLTFMRCNGRHHSLALAPVPIPKRIVHLMIETRSVDDVGRALYRCIERNIHLSFTLGRHSNDDMLSFYPMSPSGFDIEYGWGGLAVDEASWRIVTHETMSAWGHKFQRPPRPAKAEGRADG